MNFARPTVAALTASLSLAGFQGCSSAPKTEQAAVRPDSNSPYIDRIRSRLEAEDREKNPGGVREAYLDRERKRIEREDAEAGSLSKGDSYIARLKRRNPEAFELREESPTAYLDAEKQRLGPDTGESAIQKFKEGRSALKANKQGQVRHAIGLRLGALLNREITSRVGGDFATVYGSSSRWAPDITLQYEYQLFHGENIGSLGVVGTGGISFYQGTGTFTVQLSNPVTGEAFPSESRTKFQFFILPVSAGLNYRLNVLRVVRPYIQVLPSFIGYLETRSDTRPWKRSYGLGLNVGGGVNIPVGWLDPDSDWSLYSSYGVKKYSLTLDYTLANPLYGDVRYGGWAFSGGLTYEF